MTMIEFTKMEKLILAAVKKGTSYEEIATKLNISLPTIKVHLSNIYSKTAEVIEYRDFRKFIKLREYLQSSEGAKLIDSAPTISQQPEEKKRTELTQDKQIKTDIEKCVNSLTNQERAIFHSLAKTANYEETAKAFFISLSTLKSHVNSIFQKLYVNSLPELIKTYYTKIYNSKILENTDISQVSDLRNKYMDKLSKLQSEISNIKIKISVLDDLKKQIINEKT